MSDLYGFPLTENAVGSDLVNILQRQHEIDTRKRKREIQAVVEIRASLFVESISSSLDKLANVDSHSQIDLRTLTTQISEILGTVKPDKEKVFQAKKIFEELIGKAQKSASKSNILNEWLSQFDEDLKSVRTLRQAFYYRNKSINSILYYITNLDKKFLAQKEIYNKKLLLDWFDELGFRYLENAPGERFTKNSYLSELRAFVAENWPEFQSVYDFDMQKTLDYRIEKEAIPNLQGNSGIFDYAPNAYLLQRFLGDKSLKSNSPDLQFNEDTVEFKAVKGEGIFAIYTPKNPDTESMSKLGTSILADSFNYEDLGNISIELRRTPRVSLVIKCSGKLNTSTIASFEKFVQKSLKSF